MSNALDGLSFLLYAAGAGVTGDLINSYIAAIEVVARATSWGHPDGQQPWVFMGNWYPFGTGLSGIVNLPQSIPTLIFFNNNPDPNKQIFGFSMVWDGALTDSVRNRIMNWLDNLNGFLLGLNVTTWLQSRGLLSQSGVFNGVIIAGLYVPDATDVDLTKLLNRIHNSSYNNGLRDGTPFFIVDGAGNIYCFGCDTDAKKVAAKQAACAWYGVCSGTLYLCSSESWRVKPAYLRSETVIYPLYCVPG